MKNSWGDEVAESSAAKADTNSWGDPIHVPQGSGGPLQGLADIARYAGKQVARISTAPISGAVQGVQDLKEHHGYDDVAAALRGAIKGFMEPDSVQSYSKGLERMGVSNTPHDFSLDSQFGQYAGSGQTGRTPMRIPGNADIAGTVGEMATPIPGTGLIGKATGALEKATSGAEKLALGAGEELSGISKEALQMATTKEGRAALQANAGKKYQIGQDIATAINNADKFMPEKQIVDQAVQSMPPISLENTIQTLEDSKVKPKAGGRMLPHEKAANAKIQTFIDGLKGEGSTAEQADNLVPASDFRDLRKGLDVNIDFNQEGADIVNRALKKSRIQMKNDLLGAAEKTENPDYATAMKSWSNKLDVLDQAKDILGQTPGARNAKAEQVVSTLFGENKTHRQMVVDKLDQVFNSDFMARAKAQKMSAEFGKEGKAGFFPRYSTGKANLGALVKGGVVLSSPMLATRVTLPMLQNISKATGIGLDALGKMPFEQIAKIVRQIPQDSPEGQ